MGSSDNRLKLLRIIAWIEGLSFIFLLFVAMPMKYFAGDPALVRSGGMVHGLLFVLFTVYVIQAKIEHGWSGSRLMRVMGTAFIPFGMVLFDRMLQSPEETSR
jgi:integral membrane protein